MLNVTSKSENETFLKLHEFVSLPKLESSRNVTSKVISKVIALKQGNQNPRNNMIASCSFASTADVTQCRSNYLTQRAEMCDSTIKFNASTGEEHCERFLCGVCGTEVASDIKQVGFTVSSLFFPRPASCSRQFTPNGSSFA